MILEEFLKEINELQEYKKKYEYLLKDYNYRMKKLFELELEKWENTKSQDRKEEFIKTTCRDCRHFFDRESLTCEIEDDISKPFLREHGDGKKYISYKCCKDFEWD
jgi:hypothetical protein